MIADSCVTQEEVNMERDVSWAEYLEDDARFADMVNGIGCGGRQVVHAEDLQECDTRHGTKSRDCIRKVAFGMNFAIVGVENQETVDYAMPFRSMEYDMGSYRKQLRRIRREIRRSEKNLNAGEYLYGFRKNSKLHPQVTYVLYAGSEPWDGARTLHGILDFSEIPEELKELTADYRMNLVEIRKLEDTSVFKTDVRQVFDFIRCAEDKDALRELVEGDAYYEQMEEDAFDVVTHYTKATELIQTKREYEREGKIDMCRAITELIADGRSEGIAIGKTEGIAIGKSEGIATGMEEKTRIIVANMLARGMTDEDICVLAECDQSLVDEVRQALMQ